MCRNEVRISAGGSEMHWDIDGQAKKVNGDFSKHWVCPFCYPQCYRDPQPLNTVA